MYVSVYMKVYVKAWVGLAIIAWPDALGLSLADGGRRAETRMLSPRPRDNFTDMNDFTWIIYDLAWTMYDHMLSI